MNDLGKFFPFFGQNVNKTIVKEKEGKINIFKEKFQHNEYYRIV